MADTLRYGIMSTARIARNSHIPAARASDNSEIVAISSRDAGCYCVSALRYALDDEPTHAAAFERARDNGTDFDFSGTLRFRSGATAHLVTSQRKPFVASLEIVGESGRVALPNFFAATEVTVRTRAGSKTESFPSVNRFALQITHFSDCVLNGTALRFPPEDAIRNTRALVALKEAAHSGMVVGLDHG